MVCFIYKLTIHQYFSPYNIAHCLLTPTCAINRLLLQPLQAQSMETHLGQQDMLLAKECPCSSSLCAFIESYWVSALQVKNKTLHSSFRYVSGIRYSYLTWGTVSHRLFKLVPTSRNTGIGIFIQKLTHFIRTLFFILFCFKFNH